MYLKENCKLSVYEVNNNDLFLVPDDYLLYETYQASPEKTNYLANHSITFYYIDRMFVTYVKFTLIDVSLSVIKMVKSCVTVKPNFSISRIAIPLMRITNLQSPSIVIYLQLH